MPSIHCDCGAKYKFPDSAIGKRAKCKKCGVVLTLEDEDEDSIFAIAPDPEFDRPVARFAPPMPCSEPSTARAASHVEMPSGDRSFAGGIVWALLFLATPANLIPFFCIWFLLTLAQFLPRLGWVGMGAWAVITCWYAAFRFSVLVHAAGGDDELPQLTWSRDYVGDFLAPAFKWMGSWAVVMLPAMVYLSISGSSGTATALQASAMVFGGLSATVEGVAKDGPFPPVFILLVVAGLVAWPIVILTVALGSFTDLARIDHMIGTVRKTWPVYLATVAMVCAAALLQAALIALVATMTNPAANPTTGLPTMPSFGSRLVSQGAWCCVVIYCDIAIMRLIGVYYHHFKHRFAYNWG